MKILCTVVITLILLFFIHNSIHISQQFITGHKNKLAPNGWIIRKVDCGAVLYIRCTCETIKTVRVFFPGARQSAMVASKTNIVKSMLELKDGLVCIVGKRGFDRYSDHPPTYVSNVICDEDAVSVMKFLKHFKAKIDIVGYSMGCNQAITASNYGARGVLLVAPILEDLNSGMFLWSLRSVRNMKNLIRLMVYKICLSWIIQSINTSNIKIPYRIALGYSDVYGYNTNKFIKLEGGHKKCMDFVEKDMCDFSDI